MAVITAFVAGSLLVGSVANRAQVGQEKRAQGIGCVVIDLRLRRYSLLLF